MGYVLLGVAILATWFGLSAICFAKGKPTFALTNLFLGPGLIGLIGSVRLAKPGSWWYRRRYDGAKREVADARFSKVEERGYRPETLLPGMTPTWTCTVCGDLFLDDEAALRHADSGHLDLRFEDAKAAMERVPAA